MTRRLSSLMLMLLSAAPAAAQFPYPYPYTAPTTPYQTSVGGPFYRPPVLSPYLNLNNRGNPAVNYYNFVQPQLQPPPVYGAYQGPAVPSLGGGEEVAIEPHDPSSRMPRPSGHPTTFNSTGSYFNSLGTIGFGQAGRIPQQPAPTGRRR